MLFSWQQLLPDTGSWGKWLLGLTQSRCLDGHILCSWKAALTTSWKGKISVQDETLWAIHSSCALKVCTYLWHFQENFAEIKSATADLFLQFQSMWFLRKKGPAGANFPLFQNKEPNREVISSMPWVAMSNITCNAASLRWGKAGKALSQPHVHPSKGKEPISLGWGAAWMQQQVEIQAWNGLPAQLCAAPYLSFDAIMSLTNLQICTELFI